MKKIINFRPFVLFAMSLVVGIVLATFVFTSENLKLVFFIFFLSLFISSIVILILFKAKFLKYLAVCLLLIVIPTGQMFHIHHEMNNNLKFDETEVVICGRIAENYKFTNSGNLKIEIDKVTIIGADFKENISGRIVLYSNSKNYDLNLIEVGRNVSVFGKIKVNNFDKKSNFLLSNLSNNIVASCYVNYSSFEFENEIDKSLDESVRIAVWNKIQSYEMKYDDIGYAMMFGDSSQIDDDVISTFRTTGIAHLLAVSGLHVSIIAVMISFLLKLLKFSKRANFAVMFVLLFAYCYLCSFSVSVVRASIMSLLYLYLSVRGKCYDRLSALAFAMCIILLASPLKLFNVSFILSFSAVYAITLLTKSFEDLFNKFCHKKLTKSLSLIFAVQVGLILVQIYFFKNYNPMSILSNFISVPVATIAFMILIASIIISSILPFMSFMSIGYEYLMGIIVKFNYTLSKLPIVFVVNNLNFLVVIFGFLAIALCSGFVFVKKRYKVAGMSIFAIICTILAFV